MITRDKGPNWTYKHMFIKDIFDPGHQEKVMLDIFREFSKKYPAKRMADWEIKDHGDTLFGHKYVLEVMLKFPYFFYVSCYRDGWHIKLLSKKEMHNNLSIKDREIVFGKSDSDQAWSTENENVAKIMIRIADKVEKEYDNLKQ